MSPCWGEEGRTDHTRNLCDSQLRGQPLVLHFSKSMDTTPHVCYEGACASGPKRREFSSSRALRQHENRCHQDTPEEETSLGSARSLKRKRDAEDKEEQERQRLKAQLTFEAATRVPDPPVVWLTAFAFQKAKGFLTMLSRSHCSSAPLTLDFNVRRKLGDFLRASGTPYRHRQRQSTSTGNIARKLKYHNPFLTSVRNLKTSQVPQTPHTPRTPTRLGYSENIPLSPPTTHATLMLLRTFPQLPFPPSHSLLGQA